MKTDKAYQAIDIERMARQRAERIQRKIDYSVDTSPRALGPTALPRHGQAPFSTSGKDLSQQFLDCLLSVGGDADHPPNTSPMPSKALGLRSPDGEQAHKSTKHGTSLKNFPLKKQEGSTECISTGGTASKEIHLMFNHSVLGNVEISGHHTPGVGIKLKVILPCALKPKHIENLERFMSGQLSSQVGVPVEVKIG